MRISQIQSYNQSYNTSFNSQKSQSQPSFTGLGGIKKGYDNVTEWLAKNYYVKFYKSKFAKNFVEKTKGKAWNNMTTHMSALGSTLISGMYIARTLSNEKLDEKKRRTLAINDALTWGVSTASMYLADAKLANWWEGVTTRFAANYMLDNPKAKRPDLFGEWEPKDLKIMMNDWHEKLNPKSKEGKELVEQLGKKAYTSIRDFNLDVLKDKKLTTFIDGMGVLKSLFIFGMIYRYIVPVLVMKPANYIGRKLHEKEVQNNNQPVASAEKK